MGNIENLVPNEDRTPEERRRNATKAGIASGEARRKKRALRELIEIFGSLEITDEKVKKRMASLGIKEVEQMTNDMALVIGQYVSAQRGNTNAANFIRDTKGERPTEVIENHNIEYTPLIDLTKRKKNGSGQNASQN